MLFPCKNEVFVTHAYFIIYIMSLSYEEKLMKKN